MIRKFKASRVAKKLDAMNELVKRRRSGDLNASRDHNHDDFLTNSENREYARLAKRHFELTGTYKYFNPKKHAVMNDDESPKAFLTVLHDTSRKVSMEYGEDGRLYRHVDGVRDETDQYGADPEFFFVAVLTHPEIWQASNEELLGKAK